MSGLSNSRVESESTHGVGGLIKGRTHAGVETCKVLARAETAGKDIKDTATRDCVKARREVIA